MRGRRDARALVPGPEQLPGHVGVHRALDDDRLPVQDLEHGRDVGVGQGRPEARELLEVYPDVGSGVRRQRVGLLQRRTGRAAGIGPEPATSRRWGSGAGRRGRTRCASRPRRGTTSARATPPPSRHGRRSPRSRSHASCDRRRLAASDSIFGRELRRAHAGEVFDVDRASGARRNRRPGATTALPFTAQERTLTSAVPPSPRSAAPG